MTSPEPAPAPTPDELTQASYLRTGTFNEFMTLDPFTRAFNYYNTAMDIAVNPEVVGERDRLLLAWGVHYDEGMRNLINRAEEDQWFTLGSEGGFQFHSGWLPFGVGGGDVRSDQEAFITQLWDDPEIATLLELFAEGLDPAALGEFLTAVGDDFTADLVLNPTAPGVDVTSVGALTGQFLRGIPGVGNVVSAGMALNDNQGLSGAVEALANRNQVPRIQGRDDIDDARFSPSWWAGRTAEGALALLTLAGGGLLSGTGTAAAAASSAARGSGQLAARTVFQRIASRLVPEITAERMLAYQASWIGRAAQAAGVPGRSLAHLWSRMRAPARLATVGVVGGGVAATAFDQISLLLSDVPAEAVRNADRSLSDVEAAVTAAANDGRWPGTFEVGALLSAIEYARSFGTSGTEVSLGRSRTSSGTAGGEPPASPLGNVAPAGEVNPATGLPYAPAVTASDSVDDTGTVAGAADPYLGVPANYQLLTGAGYDERDRGGLDPGVERPRAFPLYRSSSPTRIIGMMTPAQRESLMARMTAAGIIDKNTTRFANGRMTSEVYDGFGALLGEANFAGENWEQTLERFTAAATRARIEAIEAAQAPISRFVYLPPDYATLAADTRARFIDKVGRDPTEAELRLYADELAGFDRAAQERDWEIDQVTTAATTRQNLVSQGLVKDWGEDIGRMKAGTPATLTTTEATGVAPRDIDPNARLSELLEERYGPEVDRRTAINEWAGNFATMVSSSNAMRSRVGG